MNNQRQSLSLIILAAAFIFSCTTVSREIAPDIAPGELFQKAQEAYNEHKDSEAAIFFYTEYLSRFPGDLQKSIEIQYELAFIYFQEEEYEEAERRLLELIDQYSGEAAQLLPEWPKVLAEKLIIKIHNIQNPLDNETE